MRRGEGHACMDDAESRQSKRPFPPTTGAYPVARPVPPGPTPRRASPPRRGPAAAGWRVRDECKRMRWWLPHLVDGFVRPTVWPAVDRKAHAAVAALGLAGTLLQPVSSHL